MVELTVLKQALGNLDEDLVSEQLNQLIARGPNKQQTQEIVAACQQGMEIVGENYEKGEYFVGDLIFAGELLTTCIDRLKPLLGDENTSTRGKIVLGTVEGDIHDIGKNIFSTMIEAAGFMVIDLGIDQPPDAFIEAIREHSPDIVALSGVMTLSIESMKRTVEALDKAGLRNKVKVTIGGNAVSAEACQYVKADAWSKNAAETVVVCGNWV